MQGLQNKVNLLFGESGRKFFDRKLRAKLSKGERIIYIEERRKMMKEK
jgi:hypothetical protein